jgi:hypothetical protein
MFKVQSIMVTKPIYRPLLSSYKQATPVAREVGLPRRPLPLLAVVL